MPQDHEDRSKKDSISSLLKGPSTSKHGMLPFLSVVMTTLQEPPKLLGWHLAATSKKRWTVDDVAFGIQGVCCARCQQLSA